MELMKSQVNDHFVLGGGVNCSPLSAGGSNIFLTRRCRIPESDVPYVIERESRSGTRFVAVYRAANGKYKSAGTCDSHERAYEVAEEEERHARGFPRRDESG
jgi:hypothetical protein